MATTTNYSWTTPDDTALVKDGAAAIRTLGSSIDTTTKALNPETTLGDISYRSSTANTKTRLAIGTTGQVLSVSGGVPAWTTISTGTKIGQVAQTFLATTFSSSSGSFVDVTGLSVSITPTATTSKILVLVSITQGTSTGAAGNNFFQLVRDTTAIGNSTGLTQNSFSAVAGAMLPTSGSGQTGTIYLDSPSTTSATTYKIQMRNDGGYTAYVNRRGADTNSGGVSTITVMEVVA